MGECQHQKMMWIFFFLEVGHVFTIKSFPFSQNQKYQSGKKASKTINTLLTPSARCLYSHFHPYGQTENFYKIPAIERRERTQY